jgi:hypothetical protein
MSAGMDHGRLRRLFLLGISLVLIVLFAGEPVRAAPLQASTISLQMSNPSCVQARPASGTCSIEIQSLFASGSDPSFSRLEVLLNGKLRVYLGGFFESSGYLTPRMLPGGLQVVCGRPNDGGLPDYGRSYTVTANAYMADGTSASDSMNVFCPAYEGRTYLPLLHR